MLRNIIAGGFPEAQMVQNLPVIPETWVRSLSQEDPLEKAWQPTLVFLSGESHGEKSLVGYNPWGHKESNMTDEAHTQYN